MSSTMDIQYVPATVASVREMFECGLLAFENDGLNQALYPPHLQDPEDAEGILQFSLNRLRKRLEAPGWDYVLATTKTVEGETQVVGYAGWLASVQDKESGQETSAFDAGSLPRGMDVDAYKHAVAVVSKTQTEILGEEKRKVWYLASLAVDPNFRGRSIASKLVQYGLDKADGDGLPAYLESSPVAVGLYRRLGFEVVRTLSVIKDNDGHFLTIMMRQPSTSAGV